MSNADGLAMIRRSYEDTAISLADLRQKWKTLLDLSSNDPKLIEVDEKLMEETLRTGVRFIEQLDELTGALYRLAECGVDV